MLFKETLAASTLDLLIRIMKDEMFAPFTLVGGTALSLLIGHRKSIDLDFFSQHPFDTVALIDHLRLNYNFELDYVSKNTVKGEVEGVQLDFIAHQYPLVEENKVIDGIRMATLLEIAAMKLNAITTNGTRVKDFIDLAFISSFFSLNSMLESYEKKYHSNQIIALKSLTYFQEINIAEPIVYISDKPIQWKVIENRLLQMNDNPRKVFGKLES